jgi:hypothetical protein
MLQERMTISYTPLSEIIHVLETVEVVRNSRITTR